MLIQAVSILSPTSLTGKLSRDLDGNVGLPASARTQSGPPSPGGGHRRAPRTLSPGVRADLITADSASLHRESSPGFPPASCAITCDPIILLRTHVRVHSLPQWTRRAMNEPPAAACLLPSCTFRKARPRAFTCRGDGGGVTGPTSTGAAFVVLNSNFWALDAKLHHRGSLFCAKSLVCGSPTALCSERLR